VTCHNPVTKQEKRDVLRFCASKEELADISKAENLEKLKKSLFLAAKNSPPSLG